MRAVRLTAEALRDMRVSAAELGLIVTGLEIGLGAATGTPTNPTDRHPLRRLRTLGRSCGPDRVALALGRTLAEIDSGREHGQ